MIIACVVDPFIDWISLISFIVPDTLEWIGAEIKAEESAIFSFTKTFCPTSTIGSQGAPICWESGKINSFLGLKIYAFILSKFFIIR